MTQTLTEYNPPIHVMMIRSLLKDYLKGKERTRAQFAHEQRLYNRRDLTERDIAYILRKT